MPLFEATRFRLASGAVLPRLQIAYETYGEADAGRRNVILVAHGATSSHHAAGDVTPDRRRGWWDEVIGPGKLLDTERYCVISSNMLGSCYGSTGPASIDPDTGRRYGPRFPDICFEDIVAAQHLLLTSLGVDRLHAVAGSSLGGYQAFQWAVSFPGFMSGIIALDTAPRDLFDSGKAADDLVSRLSRHPNWNGGDYGERAALEDAMTALRIETLKSYGFAEQLEHIADPAEREHVIAEVAADWAAEFDANSLIALRRAMGRFDVEPQLDRIRAPLLYVLADTDAWFPARIGQDVMARLEKAGVAARFHEVRSPYGHYATTREPEKWTPLARQFLERL